MGLLDMIAPGSDGDGFLDFLKRNALAATYDNPGAMPSDVAQYGAPGMVPGASGAAGAPIPLNPPPIIRATGFSGAPASAPIFAPPAPQQGGGTPMSLALPAASQAAPGGPGIGDRLAAGAQSFVNSGGPLPAVVNGLTSLFTGQRTDPGAIAQQQQAQIQNVTARALVGKGITPEIAIAAVQPGNGDLLKHVWDQAFNQSAFRQETDKDGNVWNVDTRTGQRTIALQAKDDKFSNVVVKNPDGSESIRSFNTKTGEYGAPQGAPPGATGEILGDASKTGADYIASLPADKRDTVKGMIDGTIQPPTSFAAAKPYWQQMIAAAKHADPAWDENNWAARHKMSVDLASSGNSSMGGILSNGESSFKHLAEYTKSAVDQGNVSHNFPLGGLLAHGQNYAGNTLGGSDTQAKVKATNDNLGHYGQESTKFYAGTGGGVEERMNALKEMNAGTTSGEESAAYAEKEKGLMLDRLNQKLLQIKNTFGEEKGNAIIAQHMPEIQKSLKTINDNIDRLRGIKPGTAGSASFGSQADVPGMSVGAPASVGTGVPLKPGAYTWSPEGGIVPK